MERIKYRIEYSEELIGIPKNIPQNIRKRIEKAIEERLTTNPNDYGKPLIKEWKDYRRLRVGDYRIIYKVYEEKIVVLIVEIDNRKVVYE